MPATAFDIIVEDWLLTTAAEAVHGHNPHDRGGDTWWGISRRWHPRESWPPTRERAIQIYRQEYWDDDNLRLDNFKSLPMQMVLMDAAVQHDPRTAARLFQLVLNGLPGVAPVTVDGWLGPQTLEAYTRLTQFDRDRELQVAQALLYRRGLYYWALSGDPGELPNLRGWLRRLALLGQLLLRRHLEVG